MKRTNTIAIACLCVGFAACEERRVHDETRGETAPTEREERDQTIATESKKDVADDTAEQGVAEGKDMDPEEVAEEADDASNLVSDAAMTIERMKSDSRLATLMGMSKGVFVAPNFGRAALGAGVQAGEGVLLTRSDTKWGDPVFYNVGGISLGAQLGAEGGDIALILISDEAIESFKGDDTFTINADAKLTLADYSKLAETNLGKNEDVVFWSGTKGLFAGIALGVTDIAWDEDETAAYYGKGTSFQSLWNGKANAPPNSELTRALSDI